MKKKVLTIATRESPLALWQANWVKASLELLHPQWHIQLLGLTTQADKMLSMPLYKVGGKGLFVKELEEALVDCRADIAVHSMKDVPMVLPDNLCLPVMCEREDPRDAWVSPARAWRELPQNSTVGTSSLRRQSQLLLHRPDLNVVHLRGNVNTRLGRLDAGEYAGIVLAAAGLKRLGLSSRIHSYFTVDDMLPAAGQGVLGIECRKEDDETRALIAPLNHSLTYFCVSAERAMCRVLGGGCQVPIAAYAQSHGDQIHLRGLVASPDGTQRFYAEFTDAMDEYENLGKKTAEALLQQGAGKLLSQLLL